MGDTKGASEQPTTSTKEKRTMRNIPPEERETIIRFGRTEDLAFVFTYERTWQTHCEKVLGLTPTSDNGYGGKEYEFPKTWIRKPRKSRRKEEVE